jgi:2-phospho-L-lactate transferase/gluconeogenesis factor (CofD/UPF0052 family)
MKQFSRWIQILYRAGSRRRFVLLLSGLLLGVLIIGVGFAYVILFIANSTDSIAPLSITPAYLLGGLALITSGLILTLYTIARVNERMIGYINPGNDGQSILNLVYERMVSADKPRVVVFSNGIGLFILLNALKDQVSSVDVVLPQGEDTQIYGELLQANHLNLRNVFISKIPNGTLCAEFNDDTHIEGMLAIKETRNKPGIRRLYVQYSDGNPADTSQLINTDLIDAIQRADAVIFGPTSLFSGIIASLLPADVSAALRNTRALKAFICPVMTEPGKTDNFSVSDHVAAVEQHGHFNLDYVILNTKRISYDLAEKYYDYGAEQVLLNLDEFEHTYLKVDFSARLGEVRQLNHAVLLDDDMINASVQKILGQADEKLVVRHDPDKLKAVFAKIFDHIEYRRNLRSPS